MSSREIKRHNETVLRSLEPGDIVEFPRGMYSHFALYTDYGYVIHLSGENDGIGDGWQGANTKFSIAGHEFNKAFVKEEEFYKVAGGSKAKKSNKDHKCPPVGDGRDIVQRARDKLGEIGYNVLWKNCEHFVAWCRYNVDWSDQVDTVLTWGAIGATVAAFAGLAWGMSRQSRNREKSEDELDRK